MTNGKGKTREIVDANGQAKVKRSEEKRQRTTLSISFHRPLGAEILLIHKMMLRFNRKRIALPKPKSESAFAVGLR